MLFIKGATPPKSEFIAPDGTIIYVAYTVSESDPPQYTYRIRIGDGPINIVKKEVIHQTMHYVYAIPNEEIPLCYLPDDLIKNVQKQPVNMASSNSNKSEFISQDGIIIYISRTVAESDPPQYSYRIRIGEGPVNVIEKEVIYQTLHDIYGIPNEEIPLCYLP